MLRLRKKIPSSSLPIEQLLLLPLLFVVSGLSVEVIEEKLKRTDVDLSTCIENFDVHKDKIIRTADSISMGAKYLNEMDLDSREECLRLCCETENCDVFVFEEKSAGSCYLFQCGPPEDFKCKFTHHVNYTSAVLAINRHLPDLESQIKLTKHVQDLSKLRKPEVSNQNGNAETAAADPTIPSTTTTTAKIKVIQQNTNMKSDNALVPSRKCSNYQFECRSTGECIAIYNACDGIPQCADGSDEAPELRCPESSSTISAAGVATSVDKSRQNVGQVNSIDAGQNINSNEFYHPQQMAQRLVPKLPAQQQQMSLPSENFLSPVVEVHGQVQYPNSPQVQPQYQAFLPQQPSWAQQVPLYPNKNSHIFNHKESGLQVADAPEQSQVQYGSDGKGQNYYLASGEGFRQFPQYANWPNPADGRQVQSNQFNVETVPESKEMWNSNVQQDPEKMIYNKPATKDLPATWKIENVSPKHEQEKMAHELKHSKEHFSSQSAKLESRKKITEMKLTADVLEAIEDGVSETPSGAVLSLTLGLLITCLMVALIGCRMRVVRRRLRRGGKSYAHDADYLVNGMYL